VSACGQTAAFSVACSKLRPNGLCLDAEVLSFSAPHRFADAADGGFRRPYPYAFRLQGFHFAILLLWRITIGHGDNCHNMRRLLL